MSFYPVLAAVKTATPTSTVTPTYTPTPTDSLDVFETATPVDPNLIYISSPPNNSNVYGTVNVSGKSAVENFSYCEVSFAYTDNPAGTWFLISKNEKPVTDSVLVKWDTASISDGVYDIRLRVFSTDGQVKETFATKVKLSNYTATETPHPTLTPRQQPTRLPSATATPTRTPYPTPTLLPANPAHVDSQTLWKNFGKGALTILIIFSVTWAMFSLNRRVRM